LRGEAARRSISARRLRRASEGAHGAPRLHACAAARWAAIPMCPMAAFLRPSARDDEIVPESSMPVRSPPDRNTDASPNQEALLEKEPRWRAAVDLAPHGVVQTDSEGRILFINEAFARMTGGALPLDEDASIDDLFLDCTEPERPPPSGRPSGWQPPQGERRLTGSSGSSLWVDLHAERIDVRVGAPYWLLYVTDITARKDTETRLRRLNRLYAVQCEIAQHVSTATTPRQLFEYTCRTIVDTGGLRLALVVHAPAQGGPVRVVCAAGEAGDYLESLQVSCQTDDARSRGTIGSALRTGVHDVCNDIRGDPRMAPWREHAVRNGFASTASFPIRLEGPGRAVLTLVADAPHYFRADEIQLMVALGESLSVALAAMHQRSRRAQAEALLGANQRLLRMSGRLGRLGAWSLDLASGTLTWSDEVLAIHDVGPEYAPSVREMLRFYLDDDRRAFARALTRCRDADEPFDIECEIVTAKGRRCWIRVMGESVKGPSGRTTGLQGALQDISDRRRAADEHRAIAERMTTTLDGIGEAFFTVDKSWQFTFVNRQLEAMLDRPRAELLGRPMWQAVPELRNTVFHAECLRAMEGEGRHFQEAYARKGLLLDVRAYPAPHGLAVYLRDIGEEVRARTALQDSEERFRLLARATNDAIWDWDLRHDRLWWSEGLRALFGYDDHEVSPLVVSWADRVHPEDRDRVLESIQEVLQGSGDSWFQEYRFTRKDGRHVHVEDRGHVVRDAEGRPVRMIGGMSDVTARRLAEERMSDHAALLDQARDAITVHDLDMRLTYMNLSAETAFGWSTADAMGLPVSRLFGDQDAFKKAHRDVLARGEWSGELIGRTRNGAPLLLDTRWTLLRDESGKPRSILSICADITGRRELENQLLRTQRLESIGRLAGGIAHDLNNVLTPILLSTHVLMLNERDERRQRVLTMIDSSAKRGASLVKQVLQFARGVEGERVPVNIGDLLRDVERIANETFLKDITVRTSILRDAWTVTGDPTQLHQVLLNLCVNARDAMHSGGVLTIGVTNHTIGSGDEAVRADLRPGDYVVLSVQDTGTGMTPEVAERIFEPFFTTKDLGKGTGLGLPTSLAVVKSHGGAIRVESEVGRGTTFRVYLPAESDPEDTEDPMSEPTAPRGNGELILVIDDEDAVRRSTKTILEAFGYRTLLATDGGEGVALFATHQDEVAVVLTDMMMPVMDGESAIRVILRIRPTTRIIAASGLAEGHIIARATSQGVKDFLSKPYTADALLWKLQEVLRNY
jgi:PAS domain S-box-containing protein